MERTLVSTQALAQHDPPTRREGLPGQGHTGLRYRLGALEQRVFRPPQAREDAPSRSRWALRVAQSTSPTRKETGCWNGQPRNSCLFLFLMGYLNFPSYMESVSDAPRFLTFSETASSRSSTSPNWRADFISRITCQVNLLEPRFSHINTATKGNSDGSGQPFSGNQEQFCPYRVNLGS